VPTHSHSPPPERRAEVTRRAASAGTVLRCVLDRGPIARSTIARATGLSPASVTGHSAQLARLGLIRELPEATRLRTAGRPHIPVDLDTSRYLIGAVHIAVPHTTTALLDLRGQVIARRRLPHTSTDPSSIARRACTALTELLDQQDRRTVLLGLGAATGGRVDGDSGAVIEHPLLGWRDVPLRELLAERSGLLVLVDGHSRALLAAERLFGAARGRTGVMQLFIGNVVDAAFANGETVYQGPRSQAGAIAHLPIQGQDGFCACGRTGCLQAAVAEPALTRRAYADGLIPEPVFSLLLDAALAADPAARGLFVERARTVGHATALLMDIFDPELVVVVEPGVMFLPECLAALHAEVRDRLSAPPDVPRTVVATGFGRDVLAIAGGAVILDALYRDPLSLLAAAHHTAAAAA